MEQQQQLAHGWAARDASGLLYPSTFYLRKMTDEDVTVRVLYCGICHTDLCTIKNVWQNAKYPVVPGHEIVGVVTAVGAKVNKFKVEDKVGIGYMANSCLNCDDCREDYENYCTKRVPSFNGIDLDGSQTYGGFSTIYIVKEHFAVKLPENLPLAGLAPLMCAGITVYSPLKFYGLDKPGKHVGVVGLGGLGHMAVKFARAFGMKVTVISTSPGKEKEAIEGLGAHSFIVSRDTQQMQAAISTMDGILDTVPYFHELDPLIKLLKRHGKLILVGGPSKPLGFPAYSLVQGGKSVGGSCIGGMKETQEMMDFAGEHKITANVEVIGMDYVNTAMDRLEKGDVAYRFVADLNNSIVDDD